MTLFGKKNRPIIEVRDLVAGFGDDILLKNINFDVKAGEIFVILGASGCGKSTLFKHLVGLISPLSGSIIINGLNISDSSGQNLQKVLAYLYHVNDL